MNRQKLALHSAPKNGTEACSFYFLRFRPAVSMSPRPASLLSYSFRLPISCSNRNETCQNKRGPRDRKLQKDTNFCDYLHPGAVVVCCVLIFEMRVPTVDVAVGAGVGLENASLVHQLRTGGRLLCLSGEPKLLDLHNLRQGSFVEAVFEGSFSERALANIVGCHGRLHHKTRKRSS